ncbi:ScbR family autoregulator-binding transcription factor [Kitasatospora atroaurantiaca]|uniref:TetR family transcriptional regulator n=1 Tax=Kitasatospora atroaurantiaca TaxID=285545 RepID=A0A561ETA2_9ACTN|nr:ScbR family autoregulator-binding transcription factor [Kitasatospora atroaurantiaca]TWE18817.1 TetR family transcriptional regulator [Kitasatospora atroaurantiaca]
MEEQPKLAGWASKPPSARRSPDLRQDRAHRTRELVLHSAAELFATRGFHGTSVQDVATAAGMTKGAVYFHFPSKDVLALAVVEEHYTRWPALLEAARARKLGPFDTVLTMVDGAAEAFAHDAVVQAGARLQIESNLIGLPLPTPYVGWIDLLTALLTEAADQGELRAGVDPAAAARTIVSAFFGMQHVSATLHQRADLLERWQEVRELVLLAIRA